MKVGLLLATSTGGVGAHVRTLAAGLTAAGVDVVVAGPPATETLFGFGAAGARFLPTGGRLDVGTVRGLGVDVVHAHGLRAGLLAGLAARPPVVVTWHNAVLPAEHGPVARAVLAVGERLVARRADVTLAASSDLLARAWSLGARDVRLAPVALEHRPPSAGARERVRARLGLDASARVVLTVARLHPQKGLDVLVDAAAGWDATVLLAGDGPLHDALARRIDRSGAAVRLLGRRDDVPDLLAAADVAVLPSRWEARSLFAQEAVLAGVALVATRVGGLPELLGDAARWVAPDDPAALHEAVARILADPAAADVLAAAGRRRATGWPDAGDTTRQVMAVYRELTDARA